MLRVLVIFLVGCGGAAMQTVRLVNRTDRTIEAVYIYPTAAADHGASRAKLAPNAETKVPVPAGNVDVLGVMEKVRVDATQSETRRATETIELRGPAVVVFHEADAHPAELNLPGAFGVTFRQTPAPPAPEAP